jgi:hypothetical protein
LVSQAWLFAVLAVRRNGCLVAMAVWLRWLFRRNGCLVAIAAQLTSVLFWLVALPAAGAVASS